MSHIVQIQTEVRDQAAVQSACHRLGLPQAEQGTFDLFSEPATGLAVKLPGWDYPVVCDTATGKLKYDNFNGCWGEQKELDRFLQAYTVEKAKVEARKKGYSVTESQQTNGNVLVTINTGESQPGAQPSLWGRFRSFFGARS